MAHKPQPHAQSRYNDADEPRRAEPAAEPQPPREPTQAEKDKDRLPLEKAEAEQLLRAGTRLRIKGEDPNAWIAMTRHAGDLAVSYAATPEAIEEALEHQLLLADV